MGRLAKGLGSRIVKERFVNSSLVLSSSKHVFVRYLATHSPNPLLQEFYLEVTSNRIDSALKLYEQLVAEPGNSKKKKDIYSAIINILDGATHLAVAEGNRQ